MVVTLCVSPDERGQSGVRVNVPEFVGAEGWTTIVCDICQFGMEQGERGFAFDESFPVEIEGRRTVCCCRCDYCARVWLSRRETTSLTGAVLVCACVACVAGALISVGGWSNFFGISTTSGAPPFLRSVVTREL